MTKRVKIMMVTCCSASAFV